MRAYFESRLLSRLLAGLSGLVVAIALSAPVLAARGTRAQNLLAGVNIEQRLGSRLPLDAVFTDEQGRSVELGRYFGKRPVVLALVYYECPMLCTLVLNGLVKGLRPLRFTPGRDFDVVVLSFNPKDTPVLAAAKKKHYLSFYGKQETADGWHFLTGGPEAIHRVTETVGFRYVYDPQRDQFAHAAAVMIAGPDGKLARYLLGVEYAPRDLRFALVEAAANKIGSVADQLLLLCYHYDPSTGRYTAVTMKVLRIAGGVTVGLILALILFMRRSGGPADPEKSSDRC